MGENKQMLDRSLAILAQSLTFRQAQETVIAAAEAFAALPSRVRQRFNNDPAELLEFLADESNREEAVFLGLIEKPEPQESAPERG